MIKLKDKKDCCGCTACASVCAHNAITMETDALGFLYPVIDEVKCVNCNLCEKICAFQNGLDLMQQVDYPVAYALRHKDLQEIEKSQSGAAFVLLSDFVIDNGGVVYGAGYTDFFRVVHKRAVTKEERDLLRHSKYVQSDMTGVFARVKQDLRNGKSVLFSGTPCQTAGLSTFVGKHLREKLILVDIICHGVPGPYIWRDYLTYLERKEHKQLIEVNFRDKELGGWRGSVESFKFDIESKRIYDFRFYTQITIRQSCSICPYANLKRPSDITIGDFWGIEKSKAAQMGEDNKGCSLLLVNTNKGMQLFDLVKERSDFLLVSLSECTQPQLQQPWKMHPKRIQFEQDYLKLGFEKAMRKYGVMGWKYMLNKQVFKLKNSISDSVKRSIKNVLNYVNITK